MTCAKGSIAIKGHSRMGGPPWPPLNEEVLPGRRGGHGGPPIQDYRYSQSPVHSPAEAIHSEMRTFVTL